MTESEKLEKLTRENKLQKERIALLENLIAEFHKKMNSLLTFCKLQDMYTEHEILQNRFNNMYQDDD